MSIFELIKTIIGTALAACFIISPILIPMAWPHIRMAIYRFACYVVDGKPEYDENGDYIAKSR